jgi:hypothetical protein
MVRPIRGGKPFGKIFCRMVAKNALGPLREASGATFPYGSRFAICRQMSAESDQLKEQIGRSAALLRRHL